LIDSVYPFEKTADAYTRLARGEQFGKIVINVSD
jgi:NADPH:quinone reductase-like Zn-dependent oxidoreductase